MRYVLRLLAYAVIASGAILMCAMATSCAKVDAIGNAGKALIVDCAKPATVAIINELSPMVESTLIEYVDGDGKIDWSGFKDAGQRWTANLGGCLVSSVVDRLMKPPSNDPNAPKSSNVEIDREALRQGFEQWKALRFGGVTFELANGAKL